jgi:hypothetical protein
MKFTGTIATAMSGSLAGVCASHNRYGQYFRQRAIPVNPQTEYQQNVRAQFGALASRWQAVLTADQRSAWETYALNVGGGRTGLNWYIACNTVRRQTDIADPTPLDYVDDAPTTFSLAVLTPPSITVASGTPMTIQVAFNNEDPWANEVGGALFVADSRQRSPSVNFFNGPFLAVKRIEGAASPPSSPENVTSHFELHGVNKESCRFIACMADGRISSPSIATDELGP